VTRGSWVVKCRQEVKGQSGKPEFVLVLVGRVRFLEARLPMVLRQPLPNPAVIPTLAPKLETR
jgi:hypothetical protein